MSRESAGATTPDQVRLDQTDLGRQTQTVRTGEAEMEGIAGGGGMPPKGSSPTGLFGVLKPGLTEARLRGGGRYCSIRVTINKYSTVTAEEDRMA